MALNNSNHNSRSGSIRQVHKVIPEVHDLAYSKPIIDLARNHLPSTPALVRAIYFNKNSKANWLVSWHQDRTIAVKEKNNLDGWGPWSIKQGVHHVQPPLEVLNAIITIRIHLDDADENNGCLKVIPKSHKLGILDVTSIAKYTSKHSAVYCKVSAGDAIIMRPNLLHSSEKSKENSNRRILHFEYSSYTLPNPLAWLD